MKALLVSLFLFAWGFHSIASEGAASEKTASCVYQIDSLAQIPSCQPDGTLFFFDVDDTLIDFPYMLGSKAWRKYIKESARKIDSSRNWHDFFTLLLAFSHPVQTVEVLTSEYIKQLQEKGFAACGLTARERDLWYSTPLKGVDLLTSKQLYQAGVAFQILPQSPFAYLAGDSEYFSGIFFCNLDAKGPYVSKLFKNAPKLPEKVIFIDDKRNQVESVSKALTQLGIPHACYWYRATELKAKAFNPLIANIELFYFLKYGKILTDAEAAGIAEADPAKNADYYLRKCIKQAKS